MNKTHNNHIRYLLFLLFIITASINSFAQDKLSIAIRHIEQTADEYNLSTYDLTGWTVTDRYISKKSGIEHIYLRQQYNGIEINDANINIHLKSNNEVLKMNNRFIADLESKINTTKPRINAKQAIESAARQLAYTIKKPLVSLEAPKGKNKKGLYSNGGFSLRNIPVKLVYQQLKNGTFNLVWDMSIGEINHQNWWNIRVDAATGEIINKVNLMIHHNHKYDHKTDYQHYENNENLPQYQNNKLSRKSSFSGGYRVFDFPLKNPEEGGRSLVLNPNDPIASPFGWHDTDGVVGAEFTTTQGNNVHANVLGEPAPDGGTDLLFDFSLDLNQPPELNQDAAVTNIFYWTNLMHDIFYHYGFDEVSGNFQANNYGNGGLDNDFMEVYIQVSGLSCNSGFIPIPDGQSPVLSTYLCDGRDGAFSNIITIHEYGHGISRRLTGGPSTIICFENQEQMEEGWCDFFALVLTIESNDSKTTPRAAGDWFLDAPNGTRPFGPDSENNVPYTTDMSINPFTYGDINILPQTHGVGSLWGSMLWEMTWLLIDNYGFDPDVYNGSGGNNIALMLVMEAMKLQPCNAGFVDGRDAILAADMALYNGANQCLIWQAFAKRGLGFSADQGSPDDTSDGVEACDLPSECYDGTDLTLSGTIAPGTYRARNTITSTGIISSGGVVSYQAGKNICLNDAFLADSNNGSVFLATISECENNSITSLTNNPVQEFNSTASTQTGKTASFSVKNYPNPFTGETTIEFFLAEDTFVSLLVFDANGKQISSLIDQEQKIKGTHQVVFDGKAYPAGMYYYTIQAGNFMATKKMILME